jgi:hypothetical protein
MPAYNWTKGRMERFDLSPCSSSPGLVTATHSSKSDDAAAAMSHFVQLQAEQRRIISEQLTGYSPSAADIIGGAGGHLYAAAHAQFATVVSFNTELPDVMAECKVCG